MLPQNVLLITITLPPLSAPSPPSDQLPLLEALSIMNIQLPLLESLPVTKAMASTAHHLAVFDRERSQGMYAHHAFLQPAAAMVCSLANLVLVLATFLALTTLLMDKLVATP